MHLTAYCTFEIERKTASVLFRTALWVQMLPPNSPTMQLETMLTLSFPSWRFFLPRRSQPLFVRLLRGFSLRQCSHLVPGHGAQVRYGEHNIILCRYSGTCSGTPSVDSPLSRLYCYATTTNGKKSLFCIIY